jgi:hypothetical protein
MLRLLSAAWDAAVVAAARSPFYHPDRPAVKGPMLKTHGHVKAIGPYRPFVPHRRDLDTAVGEKFLTITPAAQARMVF